MLEGCPSVLMRTCPIIRLPFDPMRTEKKLNGFVTASV